MTGSLSAKAHRKGFSNFSKNAQTHEFWKTYEQLGEIKETDEVSHFIVSKNEATLELSVIVAITDKEKILSFKNVLKSCGINANLIEPKLFSIINSILLKKQLSQYEILQQKLNENSSSLFNRNTLNIFLKLKICKKMKD